MIVCPKCGKIDFYTTFEIQKVYMAYDEEGNELDLPLEIEGQRGSTILRCYFCRSKVKFYKEIEDEKY